MKALMFSATAMALIGLAAPAKASNATDVDRLTNPGIESLTPAIQHLITNPELGNCAAFMHRVKVTDLGDEIIENAINGYMSDLEVPKKMAYEFGAFATLESTPEAVHESLRGLAPDKANDATVAELATVADALTALVKATPATDLQLKGGTALYRLGDATHSDLEEELTVRMIVDRVNNEFLVFGAGNCHKPE